MSDEFKNIFIKANKIAGKESEKHGTEKRKNQEEIAKEVKRLFETFTDSIIDNIQGWSHGKGSKLASIRPKGDNNNPFATSIWNFYKPDYIDSKKQDKSLILIYIVIDADKKELFASIGIHDRRNIEKYRNNILDTKCTDTVYDFIVSQIALCDYNKEKFDLQEGRKFVYSKSLDDFKSVVNDFKEIVSILINVYNTTIQEFNFLEEDKECILNFASNDKYNAGKNMTNNNKQKQSLNQILYGPPGTGKTYNTINKALKIIFEAEKSKDEKIRFIFNRHQLDKSIKELSEILEKDNPTKDERDDLKTAFEYFKDEKRGQIEFVTFHQSYGYEEFVEGIKAIPPEEKGNENGTQMIYKVGDGIFKKLHEKAIKKGVYLEKKDDINLTKYIQVGDKLNAPRSEFEIKSIDNDSIKVLISNGQEHQASINTIKEYLRLEDFSSRATGSNLTYEPTIAKHIFDKLNKEQSEDNTSKNYILIIDEINRGNISKIFGELITLIEESKRIGKDEALHVRLPYSNKLFGVPSNLYIIGTMNTADRSIAQIDTALRRRFEFIEMLPNSKLLVNDENKPIIIGEKEEEIDIQKILKAINERIEYIYDREHQIGHSYFMPLKKEPTKAKLDDIFKVNIIPLLAEYFYGDWNDIKIVLNDDSNYFITENGELNFSLMDTKRKKNKIFSVNEKFDTKAYHNIYKQKS